MQEQVTGVIDSMFTKQVNTKRGPANVYHAMIDGKDINLGFQTQLSEGEHVTLPVEQAYGGYQLVKGPLNGSNSTAVQATQSNVRTSSVSQPRATKAAFPVDPSANGTSIVRQSSLNRAIEAVDNMVCSGVLPAMTEAEYLDKVIEIAYLFTDFGTGQREVKHAQDMDS